MPFQNLPSPVRASEITRLSELKEVTRDVLELRSVESKTTPCDYGEERYAVFLRGT